MKKTSALALASLLLVSCASGTTPDGTTITVTSTSKAITLDAATVPAGSVTFRVVNTDTIVHSLVLMKTELPHDRIPADAKDAARPNKAGILRETGSIAAGATKEFSVRLEPGNYVLVCDEPAHYLVGMHAPLVVK